MNDEEINIAIAESMGWEIVTYDGEVHAEVITPEGYCHRLAHKDLIWQYLTDYTSDLNAIHEVEEEMTKKQQETYTDLLSPYDEEAVPYDLYWVCIHATARQRCEAYLRALGKWEETGGE